MSRKTKKESYFKAKRDKDGNVYGPQTKNETKKANRKILDSKVSYSQIEESEHKHENELKKELGD